MVLLWTYRNDGMVLQRRFTFASSSPSLTLQFEEFLLLFSTRYEFESQISMMGDPAAVLSSEATFPAVPQGWKWACFLPKEGYRHLESQLYGEMVSYAMSHCEWALTFSSFPLCLTRLWKLQLSFPSYDACFSKSSSGPPLISLVFFLNLDFFFNLGKYLRLWKYVNKIVSKKQATKLFTQMIH